MTDWVTRSLFGTLRAPTPPATSSRRLDAVELCRLLSRLEQLDGIAIGVFDLDLLPARADLHLIPERQSCFLEDLDRSRKIFYLSACALSLPRCPAYPRHRRSAAISAQL